MAPGPRDSKLSLRLIAGIKAKLANLASTGAVPAAASDPAAQLAYVLANPADEAKPRTLVTFLGEVPQNIDEILEAVAAACRLRGEYPVALMTELKPDLIATCSMPIEFMPTRGHLPLPEDEYEDYVQRRWSLVLAKWNFVRQIELGASFEDFILDQGKLGRDLPAATLTSAPMPREEDGLP